MRHCIKLLAVIMVLGTASLKAQDLEVGLLGGLSGYMGDYTQLGSVGTYLSMGHEKNTAVGFHNWTAGVFARMEFDQKSPSFLAKNGGVRFNFARTDFRGADGNGQVLFATSLSEAAIFYELNIRNKPAGTPRHFWNPYLLAGGGLTFYNSRDFNGMKGRNTTSFSIPAGFGIKYTPYGPWNLGLEFVGRMISDDIDGGNRTNNLGFDMYKVLNLRVSYTIPGRYL